ncbi:hypothetical protein HYV22_01895 [Candidatus Gottesmanbacteria bacterium]|nr:hypothetical protein [Candidatus Gottesmanbacteria bacterium]
MISKRHACLATLLYADIFDYPLTASEVIYWSVLYENPRPFPKEVKKKKQFFIFPGREAIIATREKRRRWAGKKWGIARKVARILRCIPTIELIGVTGGLAMDNAKKEDDIDLFCIVAPGTIWTSRLLATMVVELLGKRRRPGDRMVANSVCLNMFMSSDALMLPKGECDWYAAHEVLQMQCIWEQKGTYQKFLQANSWVKAFLPNAWNQKTRITNYELRITKKQPILSQLIIKIMRFFEPMAKHVQLQYMKKHRTTEVVSDTVLRFHPQDARLWVKRALAVRLKPYNIPLDKVFYAR